MSTETNISQEVALSVKEFVDSKWDGRDPAVLEGIWLSMQLVSSPKEASTVINYCSFNNS
jgi:hypothetical protein